MGFFRQIVERCSAQVVKQPCKVPTDLFVGIPVPQIWDEIVGVVRLVPQERLELIDAQIVALLIPQNSEDSKQSRGRPCSAE